MGVGIGYPIRLGLSLRMFGESGDFIGGSWFVEVASAGVRGGEEMSEAPL